MLTASLYQVGLATSMSSEGMAHRRAGAAVSRRRRPRTLAVRQWRTHLLRKEDLDRLEVEALALVEELVEARHVLPPQLPHALLHVRLQLQPARPPATSVHCAGLWSREQRASAFRHGDSLL